jgi:large repetitive protein
MRKVWRRLVRRSATATVVALAFCLAIQLANAQGLQGQGARWPSLSRLASFVESAGHAVFPAGKPGSAAGRSHDASAASTRAGRGAGSKPGKGAGALSAYVARGKRVAAGASGHVYTGFNAKTSKFDPVKSSADISVFDNADGSVTKRVSESPVNFKNSSGRWEPIGTSLTRTDSGALQTGANSFTALFTSGRPGAKDLGSGELAQVDLPSSRSFGWSLKNAADITPTVDGSVATYKDILPDTTLQLVDQSWGVQEYFDLSSAKAGNSWTFPLSMTGVSLRQASNGTWELVDSAGSEVAYLGLPWATDSKFNRVTDQPASTSDVAYSLSTVNGVQELTLTLSKSWLDATSRVFPVRVDPTIYADESTGTETSNFANNLCTKDDCDDSSDGSQLQVGYYETAETPVARSFIDFPSGSIVDQGYHVTAAQLAAFLFWSGDGTDLSANSDGDSSIEVGPLTSAIPSAYASGDSLEWPGASINTSSGTAEWTDADGWSSAAACSDITSAGYTTNINRWVYVDMSDMSWMNAWETGNASSPYYGFYMAGVNDIADDDGAGDSWKVFGSAQDTACAPYFSFTETPDQSPEITSTSPASGTDLSTLTPTFTAAATSPDSWDPTLEYQFCAYSGSTGKSVACSSWSTAKTWTMPSGDLSWGQTYTWRVQAWDEDNGGDGVGYSSVSYYPFTTVAPPPLLTDELSQNSGGQGIDPSIGNYTTSVTDASVAGIGPSLDITRDYNSLDPRTSQALGAGWSSILDSRATQVLNGAGGSVLEVVFTNPDGSQSPYGRDADGTYAPPEGSFGTVTYSSTGGYTLTDKTDTVYTFGKNITPSGQASQVWGLSSITNAQGQTLTLDYNSSDEVYELVGASGRHLFVTWETPSGATYPHVEAIETDPVTAGGTNALDWDYNYDGDELASACNADSKCTDYSYESGSQYQNAVVDAGATSYWPLDDAAGTTTAASAVLSNEQSDAGTYSNVTIGVTGSPLSGSGADVASFNGSSSSLRLTKTSLVGQGYTTISLWFKTSTSGPLMCEQNTLLSGTPSNAVCLLYVGTDGKLHGGFYTGASTGMISSATVDNGEWHQAVLQAGSSGQVLYLDGTQVGIESGIADSEEMSDTYVGAGYNSAVWADEPSTAGDWYFNGDISDVALWDESLSGTEITNLHTIGATASALLTSVTDPDEVSAGTPVTAVSYNTTTGRVASVEDAGDTYTLSGYSPSSVTGSSQVFASAVMGQHPWGYWRLGEGSGATAAVNQVNSGAGTYNAATLGSTGKFSDATAASFNGSSSYVQLPSGQADSLTNASISLWFKTSTANGVLLSTSASAISAGTTTGGYTPLLYVGDDGKLHGTFWGSEGTGAMASSATVDNGAWHLVTLTASSTADSAGNYQYLYLDGKEIASSTSDPETTSVPETYVGAGFIGGTWPDEDHSSSTSNTGTAQYFDGEISDVAIYRSALSSQAASGLDSAASNSQGLSPVLTETVTDSQGDATTYKYDPDNGYRLIAETDARGYTTTYGYDTSGFLYTVTDPNGNVTTTQHDVRGNQVAKTTCQDTATQACSTQYWTYYPNDTAAQLTTASPENDEPLTYSSADSTSSTSTTYQTKYGYDNLGDATTVTSPPVTSESYSAGTYTAASSEAGLVTTDTYSGEVSSGTTITQLAYGSTTTDVPDGLLLTSVTPGGDTTKYQYYADGDLAEVTTPLGETTLYTYDNLGRVLSKTVSWSATYSGTTTDASAVTSYTYNGEGQVLTETDPVTTDAVTGATHEKYTQNTYDMDGDLTVQEVSDLGTGDDSARTTTWAYTPYDQEQSETDPDGNTTSYTYYPDGLKETMTDPEENETEYQYDADGDLTATILENYNGDNANGAGTAAVAAGPLTLESRAYDPADRLASVTNAVGDVTEYTYYDNGLQASVVETNAAGTASFVKESDSYDGAGNLTSKVTNGGALTTNSTYDADNRLVATTVDPSGVDQVTTSTYFPDSTVATSTVTAPNTVTGSTTTRETEYTYNAGDNVLTSDLVSGSTSRYTTYTRDTRGLPLTVEDSDGETITYLYDTLGQLTTTEDPATNATTYDAATLTATTATAVPETVTGYNTFGETAETQDADGNVTTYYHDADGNVTEIEGPAYTPVGSTTSITPVEKRTYTPDGQLYQDTDPLGNITTYAYDQLGDQASVKDPDGGVTDEWSNVAGQLVSETSPAGTQTAATYNYLGQMATSSVYEAATEDTNTTTDDYDDRDFLVETISPSGVTAKYGYDDLGEKTSSTDGAGNTTDYTYDGFGNVAKTLYPNGTYTEVTYNPLNEPLSSVTYSSAGTEQTSSSAGYDLVGDETSSTNALGYTETFTYTSNRLLDYETQPVSSSTSIVEGFQYDLDGNQTAQTDGNGNTTYWTYDSLGLQDTKTVPATTAYTTSAERTTDYAYDADGDLVSETAPGGVTLAFTYNGDGDLLTESGAGATATTPARVFGYNADGEVTSAQTCTSTSCGTVDTSESIGYDSEGDVTSVSGSAGTSSFTYNQDDQLYTATTAAGTTTYHHENGLLSAVDDPLTGETDTYTYNDMDQVSTVTYGTGGDVQTYGYTPLGEVSSDTITNGSATVGSISYGYNAAGELTSKTDQDAVASTYGYDEAGRLTSWDTPTTDTAYGYDADSNRTSTTTTSVATGDVTSTVTNSYDARDELSSSTSTPASGTAATTAYAYTANGTLTSEGSTAATFDAYGDQVSSGTDSFTYDALGRVVTRTRAGSTVDLSYDGVGNQLASDGTGDDYVYNPSGSLISASIDGTDVDLWTDAHTDVVGDFTSSGTALSGTAEYDPLGNVLSQTGNASGLSVGYQSGYTDSATGGVDMDARWYTPSSGQFTSADTVENSAAPDPANANPFGYANASPLDSIDPSGHDGVASIIAEEAEEAEAANAVEDETPWGAGIALVTGVIWGGAELWSWLGSSSSPSPIYDTVGVTEPCGESSYGDCPSGYGPGTDTNDETESGYIGGCWDGYGDCGSSGGSSSRGSSGSGTSTWSGGGGGGGGYGYDTCDSACQAAIAAKAAAAAAAAAAARAAAIRLALFHAAEHASTEGRTDLSPVTKIDTPIANGSKATGTIVTTGSNDDGSQPGDGQTEQIQQIEGGAGWFPAGHALTAAGNYRNLESGEIFCAPGNEGTEACTPMESPDHPLHQEYYPWELDNVAWTPVDGPQGPILLGKSKGGKRLDAIGAFLSALTGRHILIGNPEATPGATTKEFPWSYPARTIPIFRVDEEWLPEDESLPGGDEWFPEGEW